MNSSTPMPRRHTHLGQPSKIQNLRSKIGLGNTWHYDGANWEEANLATPLPARAYHKAVYTDNAILLFSDGEAWKYE